MVTQITPKNLQLPGEKEVWKGLSFGKRMMVKLGNPVSIGMYQPPGFTGPTEFFIFLCRDCKKLHIDYLHGFDKYLSCNRH